LQTDGAKTCGRFSAGTGKRIVSPTVEKNQIAIGVKAPHNYVQKIDVRDQVSGVFL